MSRLRNNGFPTKPIRQSLVGFFIALSGCFPEPAMQPADADLGEDVDVNEDGSNPEEVIGIDTDFPLDTDLMVDTVSNDAELLNDHGSITDASESDATKLDDVTIPNDDGLPQDGNGQEPPDIMHVSDTTMDTTPPRCPGGSVVFFWGVGANNTIEVTDSITAFEISGTERRQRDYACPDDFFGDVSDHPRWTQPLLVAWSQPFGHSPAWRDFSVEFNGYSTLWDYLTAGGTSNPVLARLPNARLAITSSTGSSREIEMNYVRPQRLMGYPNTTPPYELLAFEANESPEHGFKLDILGVGQNIQVQLISLKFDPSTTFLPEISYPSQWDDNWYKRSGGQLRVINNCNSSGARLFFGRRDLWTWYAAGRDERRDMSLRFIGPNGLELRRFNIYSAFPVAYGPSFDNCTSEEIIVFDFSLMENG